MGARESRKLVSVTAHISESGSGVHKVIGVCWAIGFYLLERSNGVNLVS